MHWIDHQKDWGLAPEGTGLVTGEDSMGRSQGLKGGVGPGIIRKESPGFLQKKQAATPEVPKL